MLRTRPIHDQENVYAVTPRPAGKQQQQQSHQTGLKPSASSYAFGGGGGGAPATVKGAAGGFSCAGGAVATTSKLPPPRVLGNKDGNAAKTPFRAGANQGPTKMSKPQSQFPAFSLRTPSPGLRKFASFSLSPDEVLASPPTPEVEKVEDNDADREVEYAGWSPVDYEEPFQPPFEMDLPDLSNFNALAIHSGLDYKQWLIEDEQDRGELKFDTSFDSPERTLVELPESPVFPVPKVKGKGTSTAGAKPRIALGVKTNVSGAASVRRPASSTASVSAAASSTLLLKSRSAKSSAASSASLGSTLKVFVDPEEQLGAFGVPELDLSAFELGDELLAEEVEFKFEL